MPKPTQFQRETNDKSGQSVRVRNNVWMVFWLFVVVLLVQMLGCAGYHVGNQYLFRSDIRTVHVMMFESDSDRRFLGQRLTEAVVKAVELETPMTITDPQITDSFIRGRPTRPDVI